MKNKSGSWIREIKIDMEKCQGCKACFNACFADVIRWDTDKKKPVVAYPEDCVWCLACECACPEEAIEVIPQIPAPLHSSF
ncbi:MAG TPA: ferredoxin family protein [Dehalococcoidales bacterium]|nr:ferredoxin family protein [Dehalococcoidales bacterium]